MLSINTNLSSLIVQGNLQQSTNQLNQAIERMTTGYKINHASDNAANYSIATNMDTKIGAYMVAEENASMGIDMVTTASDSVQLMQDKAERLRSLCIQTKNGTYGAQSLTAITEESNAIVAEINRIFSTAKYNGISLFSTTTSQTVAPAEATPEVATFGLTRSANSEGKFIADPVTYTDEEIEAMLANGDIVELDNDVTSFTSGQKYLISDDTQLARLATLVNGGQSGEDATFILGEDIDLGAYCDQELANGNGGWTPIGSYDDRFCGTFDGNGHVIKNLKIDRWATYQGLFGCTGSGSEIKNIGVEGGYVKASSLLGGLVGRSDSTVANSYATVDITGASDVGGLVGMTEEHISNCYATGNIIGSGGKVGGLVGSSRYATISNCYATGSVTGSSGDVGGLVGESMSTINNCYATGDVSGTRFVGGLVGSIASSFSLSINNCYATGDVIGTSEYVGGLAGKSIELINNSYATGIVTGGKTVGGLIGECSLSDARIKNSYATGLVTGSENVGGLVGTYYNGVTHTNIAAVQSDINATQMTEEEIKAAYTFESMGFTEDNGWTIENGVPIIALKYAAQSSDDDSDMSGGTTGGFAMALQVGIHGNGSSQIGFDINLSYDLSAVLADISSDEALNTVDNFIAQLSEQSTKLGAIQNRLMSVLEEISVQYDNLVSARSTIKDADMAEVSSQYIQQQILQQASATLLATANQTPALALQLL